MPTRTPRLPLPLSNGNGHGVTARTAAAYQLIPDADRSISGYGSRDIDVMLRGGQGQDTELSWYFYARIPELRYVARYIANSLSLARLYVAKVTDDPFNPEPVGPRHPANDLLANFAGGLIGQSQILDRLGLHLTIPGDAVLAGPRDGEAKFSFPFDQWRVYSTVEITSRQGRLWYKSPAGQDQPVPPGVLPVRVWRPHPRLWWEADSPTRSSQVVLREIDLLDQHVHATAVSRLAGAGIFAVPDELTLPGDEVETEGIDEDPFVVKLSEVMSIAIKNRESAAAIVPIVLRGPAEYLSALRHFDFSTAFDERVPDLRNVALRRLALGMDVPPEIMMGMADSNHWSAWQVDESTVRVHTGPLMQLVAAALSEGWLRPTLENIPLSAAQREEIPQLVVWYDLSNLTVQPNISEEAQALYDRFEIGGDTLRLRTGHGATDAPSNTELVRQVLLQFVRENNPTMAPYAVDALRELGYPFPEIEKLEPPPAQPPGRPPDTGLPESDIGPTKSLPGKRSQDKQTEPPPTPPPSGDGNRNG
jgi:hypothetical protein